MAAVGVHEAKTNLSRLIKRVEMGEEITITRSGVPVARLVPPQPGSKRIFGGDRGMFTVPDDFDGALPDEVVTRFEGG